MRERGKNQMLRPLAHHFFDSGWWHRRQRKVGEHVVQRHRKVAERVDHGAIEIDDGGIETGVVEANRVQNKQAEFKKLLGTLPGMKK